MVVELESWTAVQMVDEWVVKKVVHLADVMVDRKDSTMVVHLAALLEI